MRGRAAGVRAKVEPPFEYGRIADLYDAWFRLVGLKRGVEQFLERVDWRLPYTVKFHVASILAKLGAGR